MAAKRKLSRTARSKLSRLAKSRPRYKTGPKKGKFKPGGRAASSRKRSSSSRKRSSSSRKRSSSSRKRSTRRSSTDRRRAAARRSARGRRRDAQGRFLPAPGSRRSSKAPRRRRETGTSSSPPFPLDLALLNPASLESVKQVAKTGAGVAAGIMSGVGVRHLAQLPVPGVSAELSKDILADVVQVGTPIVLGFGLGKLGWHSVGSGMMAAGAGMAVLAVIRRAMALATDRQIAGVNRIDLGIAGDGTGVVFLRDARGRVYMEGPDKKVYRLNGLGQGNRTEPVVRVMLQNGQKANFGFVGNIQLKSGKAYHVVRDPQSDELTMIPYLPHSQRQTDVISGRAQRGQPRMSGVVTRSSQWGPRPQPATLGGVVTARSQFTGGGQRPKPARRGLSGIVTARSQFKPDREPDPGADW